MGVDGCNVTHQLHLHGKVRGCNCKQRIYQIKWGFKLKNVGRQLWNICEGVKGARVLVSDNDDTLRAIRIISNCVLFFAIVTISIHYYNYLCPQRFDLFSLVLYSLRRLLQLIYPYHNTLLHYSPR